MYEMVEKRKDYKTLELLERSFGYITWKYDKLSRLVYAPQNYSVQ